MPRAESDPIEYLVEKRFPNHELIVRLPPTISGFSRSGTITAAGKKQLSEAVEKYRSELRTKTPDELSALVSEAQAQEANTLRTKLEKEESERFFHRSYAAADFDHWSKATYWTLDEAVALAFGKSPDIVNWQNVQPLVNVSAFAKQFARVRDLVNRAKNWQQLYDPALPGFFLAWARRNEIAVPEELVKAVEERGIVIADWKDSFEKLKEQYDALLKDRDHIFAVCEKLAAQRDELHARVGGLEEQASLWQFDESAESYPSELDVAMQAWRAVSNQRNSTVTVKQQIVAWLSKNYPKVSEEARERIATMCNWEKRGGRRPQVR
jgi:hypothetical protein